MLFVYAGGMKPAVDVVGIGAAAEAGDAAAAALYRKLGEFRLDGAHCYDPNEVRGCTGWVRRRSVWGLGRILLIPRPCVFMCRRSGG